MPVTRYVDVPTELTKPLVAPAAPAFDCNFPSGKPAVCVHDGLMRELQWQALLDRANDDRATTAFLSAGASLQPAVNRVGGVASPSQLVSRPFRIKGDGTHP